MDSEQEKLLNAKNAELEKQLAAKNRDLEIEAALERVRARTMAMQHSSELKDAASILFQQVEALGVNTWTSGFQLWDEDRKAVTVWTCTAGVVQQAFRLPVTGEDFFMMHVIEAEQNGEALYVEEIRGKALENHYSYMAALPGLKDNFASLSDAGIALPLSQVNHAAFFKYGYLLFITYQPMPGAYDIFRRFAKVFEQTYTRFLDLQKAEEQAREAQIELSLERVRAKTMAMHTSEHVGETVATMFDELVKLGIEKTVRCGILIIDETKHMEVWTAAYNTNGKVDMLIGRIDMMIHPITSGIHQAWKNKEQIKSYELRGEDLIAYYRAVSNSPEYPVQFDLASLPAKQTNNAFFFPEGAIFAFTLEPLSADAVKLFKRFAGVFGQTYRRFLDLKKAEAQAREAQIEAGLERVRSRTMAMQKSDELAQTAVVVFKQLIDLGIQPNRLFIGIIHDDSGDIELWATAEDGSKISTKFMGNVNRNQSVNKMYKGWKTHKKSITIDMQGKELQDYFNYLGNELKVPFKLGLSQKRRVQLIAYFSQGFIGMASPDMQPAETTSLLERFAGVFNLTYIRFNDLKIAEAHAIQAEEDLVKLHTEKKRAEDALTELQATQKQLIQSEKMASLGELTAGIAHEIQNPLNFVNNFSEVNQEMIDELEEELKAGNIEDALAIAADIKQNEEKISHHGKRADGIVKGMLQHSRTGSGEKQLTDMNVLADEFLRLSYHGLRAKDKAFNAEMVTKFDTNLPKVNVLPQDMGRVLLNLFNNAFYAVNQKKKTATPDYKPEVSVITSSENGQVFIKVKDNGVGMPDSIKEKIMQPFFTTKPTGEGTGLGLSLTYDMVVKGHGGSIQVNSVEGEGSEFIIQLPVN